MTITIESANASPIFRLFLKDYIQNAVFTSRFSESLACLQWSNLCRIIPLPLYSVEILYCRPEVWVTSSLRS